ncbi:biosynthetic-type acetolactate synthase large subunit [Oscillospiraceae bacterium MB08-C2-2]|nr:biosynthetic-type acetolactate synthase large subunit [Oscillospiraceae bacterium MB08-C2-2]
MISGAQAMVQCLKEQGVPVVFGYPGATIAPFYDKLLGSGIRHVLTRTEQGAGHAASGYARLSGSPGVCISTSGPGATNLFTAIATAYSDSIPLVAITGQVATWQLGRDVFQEVDTTGAVEPFTKYTYLVKSADDIGRVFREAFHIASTGRKGPVLIDVPVDVQQAMTEFVYPESVSIRGYKPRTQGHPLQVRKVAEAIRTAQRPLICGGGGIFLSEAQELVGRLCEQTGIPVVSTLMGVGLMPQEHPLYFGMLGQSGTKTANTAIRESDLLILVGARVGDRAITRPDKLQSHATIVHIDIDSAEIGKNVGTTIPLVGDVTQVVEQLLALEPVSDCKPWQERLGEMKKQESEARQSRPAPKSGVEPSAFVRALCKKLPENAVYVADVGQNQIWSAKNFCGSGRFLTTGGMGTMGYSIPAALGAKLAAFDRMTIAVCGDGSFQMSMNELATMCQHDIPIKVIILRNGKLGMVREIQSRAYGGREIAVELSGSPDFGKIAEAYGIAHASVERPEELEAALEQMLQNDSAFLLECAVDPEEGTA